VSDITERKRGPALTPEKRAEMVAIARHGVRMTRRGKIIMITCVTIITAAALTGLLWIALYQANPPVRGTVLGYEVTSDRAVRYDSRSGADRALPLSVLFAPETPKVSKWVAD